ncbi:extracellular solute-binding protein [Streptomyces turgidiscabies]|nr:ABC transporter substrate-binding protein [Streptomyces turgidiscabies]MDX3496149.1 ABC transporter substrate-binding protein [Streptomyces turgidiscabies]GAQ75356.1 putative arabinose-binding protein precursor [Streptomyces turgidiscabies]
MRSIRRSLAVLAAVVLTAVTAGCGSSDSGDADGKITLNISTFSEWGYAGLLKEYQKLHPDITIKHNRFATSDEAKEQFQTALGAGSGLADVIGVEGGWMQQLLKHPDNFVDLTSPKVEGRWKDWNTKLASTADGKLLGYATDIGPQTIAYRSDLFKAAGLPTDREKVAELFGGDDATWDDFFAVGKRFVDARTGPAFYDASASVATSWADQYRVLWEDPKTGDIIADKNKDLRNIYDTVTSHEDLSAHLARWSEDWVSAFQKDKFAVMLAPSWMLGVIKGNAAGVRGWDVADVYPNGGVNSGGSYLSVPKQSKHPKEAQALAEWLTAPEQQTKAFKASGNFPSQIEAQKSPEVQKVTEPFFNDAPVGKILTERASNITMVPYRGENYFAIAAAFNDAINRVSVDKTHSAKESWDMFVDALDALK